MLEIIVGCCDCGLFSMVEETADEVGQRFGNSSVLPLRNSRNARKDVFLDLRAHNADEMTAIALRRPTGFHYVA